MVASFRIFVLLVAFCFAARGAHAERRAAQSDFFVIRRGEKLEAVRPDGSAHRVLKKSFAHGRTDWDISRDGKRICFAATPTMVINSAREMRVFLWRLEDNQKTPEILQGAYGMGGGDYNYSEPVWKSDGKSLLAVKSGDQFFAGGALVELASRTRQQVWSSETLFASSPLLMGTASEETAKKLLFSPSFSPDGKHILCVATTSARGAENESQIETDFSYYLVHFDLAANTIAISPPIVMPISDVVWHPDGKRFAFCGYTEKGRRDIYLGAVTDFSFVPLTQNAADDYNPIWNADGTRIFWLSDRAKKGSARFYSMAADGSQQRAELKNWSGIDSFKRVDALPSWKRYRNLPVWVPFPKEKAKAE